MSKLPGRFVVVVGPDGVGKTSVAGALLDLWHSETRYFHFRPPARYQMLEAPPETGRFIPKPPDRGGSLAGGWARLALNLVRFWLGYLVRVRPAIRRGALVVGDRWAYGYVVQPHSLKFRGPTWLARLALVLLPKPDLVVRLYAPAEVVRSRKAELTTAQIRTEDELWATVRRHKMIAVDTTMPVAAAARVVLEAL